VRGTRFNEDVIQCVIFDGNDERRRQSSKTKEHTMATKKRGKRAKQKSSKKKKTVAKRTLIAPKGDKRYVRRSAKGRFKESDDVGKSLSSDRSKRAKTKAKRGQGDKGD
jgi:hypothetical protein